ncbi:MAG: hypothetical protein NNA18_06125 [Nitrospira sp.]|nr:hypothetical protein [Nitrospira sp.]
MSGSMILGLKPAAESRRVSRRAKGAGTDDRVLLALGGFIDQDPRGFAGAIKSVFKPKRPPEDSLRLASL